MSNIQQLFKKQNKEFEERFEEKFESQIKGLGAVWSAEEIKSFFHSNRLVILQEIDKMCEKIKEKFNKTVTNQQDGFNLGFIKALSSLQSEIKKEIEGLK